MFRTAAYYVLLGAVIVLVLTVALAGSPWTIIQRDRATWEGE